MKFAGVTQMPLFFGALFLGSFLHTTNALAVMSVDFGSEWMKVAIVSPGVPMEIALNRESQRKTPVTVSFRDGERVFGDAALTIAVRFPEKSFMYLLDVLGKKIENPLVDLYRKRFPYYDIKASEDGNSLVFKHPDGAEFSIVELVAMVLKQSQEIAEKTAGQPIKDAVITVPAFFNQAERRAMLQAAKISGLNVLQLINSNTAVALNYGVFRRKDFNETPTNILFYDMGAGSTIATVATYQLVKSKETGEVSPQLTIKGIGFDYTLGGLEMQLRLRDHFANNRAMAKLFKEAGRVKKVLSANADHVAQVENILDDIDLKIPISRTEFEDLCSDLFERVSKPIETALKSANMDMVSIHQVILSGSGTRVPKVQEILLQNVKQELGKSLNTDESAALGAAYQAAHLSKGFKVKTFIVKDANVFPIQVDFQREYEQEDKTMAIKTVKRILFGRNNAIPLKKIMTFNRHVHDFEFFVNYGDLNFLSEFDLQALGSQNITKVSLTGVDTAVSKHMGGEATEYKGVKAHFRIDESGILNLDEVESAFEKTEEESPESQLESAISKLGSTLGRLFSGALDDKTEEPPANETQAEAGNGTQEAEKAENGTQQELKNATEPKKLKTITVKEPITSTLEYLDLKVLENSDMERSIKKLKELDDQDKARLDRAKSKNSLESFIVETRDRLFREEFERATTEEEREKILKNLNEVGEWLEYESDAAATEVFRSKLGELKRLTREMYERVREHHDRPDALKALSDMLNVSRFFLASARNVSEGEQVFTDTEINTLQKLIDETTQWLKESSAEQKSVPLHVAPKMSVKAISEKGMALDREVKYLLNKARFAQPIKKKVQEKAAKANESAKETAGNGTEPVIEKTTTESTSEKATNADDANQINIPDVNNSENGEESIASSKTDQQKDNHSEL